MVKSVFGLWTLFSNVSSALKLLFIELLHAVLIRAHARWFVFHFQYPQQHDSLCFHTFNGETLKSLLLLLWYNNHILFDINGIYKAMNQNYLFSNKITLVSVLRITIKGVYLKKTKILDIFSGSIFLKEIPLCYKIIAFEWALKIYPSRIILEKKATFAENTGIQEPKFYAIALQTNPEIFPNCS